jgi:hypothetical protein
MARLGKFIRRANHLAQETSMQNVTDGQPIGPILNYTGPIALPAAHAERCQYSAGAVENKSVDALYTVHGHPHRQDVVTMRKCKSNDNLLDSSRETCVPR